MLSPKACRQEQLELALLLLSALAVVVLAIAFGTSEWAVKLPLPMSQKYLSRTDDQGEFGNARVG